MRLIFAKNSGFCFGVRSAVETAYAHAGKNTFTYGEIIHNEIVLKKLEDEGVKCVSEIDEITQEKATVIIHHSLFIK